MLARDVMNMTTYYSQYAPELLTTRYADEMWALYEKGDLTPETELTGNFEESTKSADVDTVIEEIKAAFEEEQARIERMQWADSDEQE